MASSPTTSWHIDEGEVETVADFIFLGFKITMDLDCSHKIKTHLLLGRKKGYEKPEQCIKKQRLILLQRAVVSQLWFSSNHVQMWDLDHMKGWMSKNWAFELHCLKRFLRAPCTTRRSNQSIWKEINLWPLLTQLRHLLRPFRWEEQMLPLQKSLTMAAPSK